MCREIPGELYLKNGHGLQAPPHRRIHPQIFPSTVSGEMQAVLGMTVPREEIMTNMLNLKVDGNARILEICPNSGNTTCHLAAAHPRQALLYVIQMEGCLAQCIAHGIYDKSGSWSGLTSRRQGHEKQKQK
jgi:hypothetical protein